MNTLVIALLVLALGLQAAAIVVTPRPKLEVEEVEPGIYQLEMREQRRFRATMLTLAGLGVATIASGISLWAPGFQ